LFPQTTGLGGMKPNTLAMGECLCIYAGAVILEFFSLDCLLFTVMINNILILGKNL